LVPPRLLRLDAETVLSGVSGDYDGREDHRHVLPRLAGQQPRLVGERPEVLDLSRLHRTLNPPGTPVIGREREVPVSIEQLRQRAQIPRGGLRGFLRVRALVDVPVLPKSVLEARTAHELPDTFRVRARQRVRVEGT